MGRCSEGTSPGVLYERRFHHECAQLRIAEIVEAGI